MVRRIQDSQLWLVALGIGLGYLARLMLGPPDLDANPPRKFAVPLAETSEEFTDLPIIRRQTPTP